MSDDCDTSSATCTAEEAEAGSVIGGRLHSKRQDTGRQQCIRQQAPLEKTNTGIILTGKRITAPIMDNDAHMSRFWVHLPQVVANLPP